MGKLNPKWFALCTAAISITYAAGYIVTEPKTVSAIGTKQVHAYSQKNTSKTQKSSSLAESKNDQSSQTSSDNQSSSSVKANAKYKDGTYTGEGMNRIGSVAVSVTIKSGKIESVQITDCTTSYPQSRIDQLPQQVVSRQSTNVDNVSGATESTDDFITAVMDALSQAQA